MKINKYSFSYKPYAAAPKTGKLTISIAKPSSDKKHVRFAVLLSVSATDLAACELEADLSSAIIEVDDEARIEK